MSDKIAMPDTITLLALADRFANIDKTMGDRRFAFVLGAGASRTSGILTASEMVNQWIWMLYREANHEPIGDGREWASAESLGIEAFDSSDPAASYADLYQRTFGGDPERGFAYLEDRMSDAEPSFGYSVLARILEETRHRAVVTTNFDNLVADALAIYCSTAPLVCGHEALAGFVKAHHRRPVVVKVHRDLLLGPKSTTSEMTGLPGPLKAALDAIIETHSLIVIGYGGNDGSLMSYLEGLPCDTIPGGVYWCYWDRGEQPSGAIERFVAKQRGSFVPIPGFDEAMMLLGDRMGFGVPDQLILERANKRAGRIVQQHENLKAGLDQLQQARRASPESVRAGETNAETGTDVVRTLLNAFTDTINRTAEDGHPSHWLLRLSAASDVEEREKVFEEALQKLPESADLHNRFAAFLWRERRDEMRAEEAYQKALELTPNNPGVVGNYATFLRDAKHDQVSAAQHYESALQLDPENFGNIANYATLLAEQGDLDRADELHRHAIELAPRDMGLKYNYAVFLKHERGDAETAEAQFREALNEAPADSRILAGYADLLAEQSNRRLEADALFRRALDANPDDTNAIRLYAVFLVDKLDDDERAAPLFQRAVELEPWSAMHLCNYASMLGKLGRSEEEAEEYFKRAISEEPEYTEAYLNYGYFLATKKKDHVGAEKMYKKALALNPSAPYALMNYAVLLNEMGNQEKASECFNKSLSTGSPDSVVLRNAAGFWGTEGDKPGRARKMYESSIELAPEDTDALAGFGGFCHQQGDIERAKELYLRALALDPSHRQAGANYAGLLLEGGDLTAGLRSLERALELCEVDEPGDLEVEVAMYGVCHRLPDRWKESLAQLKSMIIESGAQSKWWDFSGVIASAERRGHPAADWLGKLADVCDGEAEPESLEEWNDWREA